MTAERYSDLIQRQRDIVRLLEQRTLDEWTRHARNNTHIVAKDGTSENVNQT